LSVKNENFTRKEIRTVIRNAAAEGCPYIIGYFFSSPKYIGNSDTMKKMLLHTDRYGKLHGFWQQ